jgi:GNAT superfamily N-acetyltransferase
VLIREFDPRAGGDRGLWDQVIELQVESRDELLEAQLYREFIGHRLEDLRGCRRRGIGSRLVVEAAHRAAERGVRHFVIAAEPDYHALGLYESLGFQRVERVAGVFRRPTIRSAA